MIAKHLTEQAPALAVVAPDVPRPLQQLVERMMAKSPAARFGSYDQLLEAAEAVRPGRRQGRTLGARGLALLIDAALLAPAAYLLGPWSALLVAGYFIVCHKLAAGTAGERLAFRIPAATPADRNAARR